MHQIRKHLAQNKIPIIADDKYGDFKLNKLIKKEFNIKKMMLLSKILTINSKDKIEIPYPEYFEKALEKLTLDH